MFVILHQDMSWSLSDAKSMRFLSGVGPLRLFLVNGH